jgi:hypothetical protein
MESKEPAEILVGDCTLATSSAPVDGSFVELDGELFYRITSYDAMPPFLMSIVSSSDTWMFLSSSGGITAGRRNSDAALFPYYSDDRISEDSDNTGSMTILRVTLDGRERLWEPFSPRWNGLYDTTRYLYKNTIGTEVIFEEVNRDLGLTFRYGWTSSDRYGFVRTSWLVNNSTTRRQIAVLDGIQNILPYGVTSLAQSRLSNLLDAYKRAELEPETGMGIYALSSTLTDLAEPSESLLATRVFQCGFANPAILLSSNQAERFRKGASVEPEGDVRGVRGAYLVAVPLTLAPSETRTWRLVADVEQDARQITCVVNLMKQGDEKITASVEADVTRSRDTLLRIVAGADGLQSTGDHLASVHHFANVLFNTMRGGTFPTGYTVPGDDFVDFVAVRNREVSAGQAEFLAALPETLTYEELAHRVVAAGAPDLERLCSEYLPLSFSRRHGDPSRPWNVFSIRLRNPDGSRRYDYQGNWRDIFQNWEALAWSYPGYLEGMIFRFVNATTADGYNPYRLTRDGFEWEVPDPRDPWANIGYWGDHQIIYLLKLLETLERFYPGRLADLLSRNVFCYANVPYRIRRYEETLEDWYNTIIFDEGLDRHLREEAQKRGTDAQLLCDKDGNVAHATFIEKLLVLLLIKLANLVPEGGIWMNTQRPEWNDANNALTGKGLSVVTTAYLRRFIGFLTPLLAGVDAATFPIREEVAQLFHLVRSALQEHAPELDGGISDDRRRAVMDALGTAASSYRWQIYENGLGGSTADLGASELTSFLALAERFIDHTLRANEREDHLYHSYNTLSLQPGRAAVGQLYEMLEGQVAILSSGLLSAAESANVLAALRKSRMYRADQHSYLLYPDRDLPGFLEKNRIPGEHAARLRIVAALVRDGDESLVIRDEDGGYHFNGRFRNKDDVIAALDALPAGYGEMVTAEREQVLELFESVFQHNSFTGRSGTFFAYEGLGSIYWHMVSKLLLAVQETLLRAVGAGEDQQTIEKLREHYYDIRLGLGFNKRPDVYGAFPTDPYSHSPAGRGAKQPGMTGQVKEEILTRPLELGLRVEDGSIAFDPVLLRSEEFSEEHGEFSYIDVDGHQASIAVPSHAYAFTFCQVPVVVRRGDRARFTVALASGERVAVDGSSLGREISTHIFARAGFVRSVTVEVESGRV